MSRLGRQGEKRMASEQCPVSYVTAESRSVLERFLAERQLGVVVSLDERPARIADAFVLLAREVEGMKEGARGE